MGIFLSILTAISFGTADFAGGAVSRKQSLSAVVLWSQLAGLITVVLFSLLDPNSRITGIRDLLWGSAAGVIGLSGLILLYRGLARGYVSIVSPLSALIGAIIPVVFALGSGEVLRPIIVAGILLTLPAIVLMSWNKEGMKNRRNPVRIHSSWRDGLMAGCLFGFFFVLISRPTPASGLWPMAAARTTSILLVALLAPLTGRSLRVRGQLMHIALIGVLDIAANIFFVLSLRYGLLSVSVIIASAYPGPTVLLARVFFKEKLGLVRLAGIALALCGIALISSG